MNSYSINWTSKIRTKSESQEVFQRGTTKIKKPRIIPRAEHTLSRSRISRHALRVLYTLHDAGYQAYLVGGCVRDLLLDRHPKDFDIATDAHPEQVRKLFRNCRLIGRRFRLAHIQFGREIIEVATFRASSEEAHSDQQRASKHGLILRDNVYGSLEDDVWRRDFTVNALYYNIADFSIVDYTNGLDDLKHRQLRLIGDPIQRYREDPVRILRALRFAAKLGFTLEATTAAPIQESKLLLQHVSPARLFEEILKLLLSGHAVESFKALHEYDIVSLLFPVTYPYLNGKHEIANKLLTIACQNTDTRIAEEKSINPAFIWSAILWYPLQHYQQKLIDQGQKPGMALEAAVRHILPKQLQAVAIPRRLTLVMREIWAFQAKLITRSARRVEQLLHHPRFRAAYDFLLLRVAAGENLQELANWWTEIQVADVEKRAELLKQAPTTAAPKRRRRRKVKK